MGENDDEWMGEKIQFILFKIECVFGFMHVDVLGNEWYRQGEWRHLRSERQHGRNIQMQIVKSRVKMNLSELKLWQNYKIHNAHMHLPHRQISESTIKNQRKIMTVVATMVLTVIWRFASIRRGGLWVDIFLAAAVSWRLPDQWQAAMDSLL